DTTGEAVVATGRLSGVALPSDDLLSDGSEDDWGDDRLSCSATRAPGGLSSSQQGGDADFAAAEPGAGFSSEDVVKPSILSPARLSRDQAQSMTCLRLALSHHRLLRTAVGQGASAEDDTFDALLSFVAAAKSQLSPWSIQTALLVLRTLFEKPDLLDEEELFALVDALRQLTQAQHRHLEVAAALLDLSSASVLPALDACSAGSNPRDCFLVILTAYATLQHEGRFNEGVTQALARLLLECSKVRLVLPPCICPPPGP
ncbi:hypothetical protein HPB47_020275, partial [Ixodes persulcatus]